MYRHFFISILFLLFLSCKTEKQELSVLLPPEPDYNQETAWFIDTVGKQQLPVDVFYIAPTCIWDWKNTQGETIHFCDINNAAQREALRPSLELAARIFADSCHFYSPYYRQISLESWGEGEKTVEERFPYAMEDVQKAFNYYWQHFNKERPFILAGFSQGGKAVVELIKSLPTETAARMVAAYAIGYKVSQQELDTYPQLRAAKDSSDVGVVICYNSVATPEAICPVLAPSDICINPQNWRTDETPARLNDTATVRVDTRHQVLLVEGLDTKFYFLPSLKNLFKEGNYHLQELTFYQSALNKNIKLRTHKYLSINKI